MADDYKSDHESDFEADDEAAPTEEVKPAAVEEDSADHISEDEQEDYAADEENVDLKTVSKYNTEFIVVKPENRRTSTTLSKYEMTEIVSIRATQIAQYNNCMVDITGLDDPIKMAKRELMMRMCPLTLRRVVGEVPNGSEMVTYVELWYPNEMKFSVCYTDVI